MKNFFLPFALLILCGCSDTIDYNNDVVNKEISLCPTNHFVTINDIKTLCKAQEGK